MQFSIDKALLESLRGRFKVAVKTTNSTFDELKKADLAVSKAEDGVSAFERDKVRGNKDAREAAAKSLAEAKVERDQVEARYVEAARLSGYYGTLMDRCQRYADGVAGMEGAARRARLEADAEAAANAAYAKAAASDVKLRGM